MKNFKVILLFSVLGLFLFNWSVGASQHVPEETEMVARTSPPIVDTSDAKSAEKDWSEQAKLWCKQVDSIVGSHKIDRVKFSPYKSGRFYMTQITLKSKVSCVENSISFFTLSCGKVFGLDIPFHINLPANKHDLLGDGSAVTPFVKNYSSYVFYNDKSVEEKTIFLAGLDIADREGGKGAGLYDYHCGEMFEMVRQIQCNKKKADKKFRDVLWPLTKELNRVLSRIWLGFQIKMDRDSKFDYMDGKERSDYLAQCSMWMAQRRLELFLLKEISEKICDGSITEFLPLDELSGYYDLIFSYIIDYARLFCRQGLA